MNKKRKVKLILSILTLLVLIIISVLFILNNPKNKKQIKYVEDLLGMKLSQYVVSNSGKITTDKNNIKHANLKFEIKNFRINDFKNEMDGKMDYYELTSDLYLTTYHDKVRKYAKDMSIDSFYHLSTEDKDIIGILCEDGGNYYFLLIG